MQVSAVEIRTCVCRDAKVDAQYSSQYSTVSLLNFHYVALPIKFKNLKKERKKTNLQI